MDPARVHVIPHGAFEHLTAPAPATPPALEGLDGRRVVLFFGLVRPYKGVDLLVEAFAATPDDAVLLVVGMPRTPIEPLERRARELGIAERVRFVPRFVPDEELPVLLSPRRRGRASLPRDRPVRCALHGARVRLAAAAQRGGRVPRDRRARRGAAGRAGERRVAARRPRSSCSPTTAARRAHGARRRWRLARGEHSWERGGRGDRAAVPAAAGGRVVTAVEIAFWVSAGLIVYTHAGYPLLLAGACAAAAPRRCGRSARAAARVARDRRRTRRAGGDRGEGAERARARLPARPAGGDRGLGRLDGRHGRAGARRRGGDRACGCWTSTRRGKVRAQDAAVDAAARRGPGVLGCERALGARRAAALVRPFADPGVGYVCGQLSLPRAGRLQPGGRLLALRERGPGAREPARVGDRRQRRDLRGAARAPTCASTRARATTCRFPSTW